MKRPLLSVFAAAYFLAGTSVVSAQIDVASSFDDRFYIAPMGAVAGRSREPATQEEAYGGGLAIGKSLLPHLAIEIDGDYLRYFGKKYGTVTTPAGCGLLVTCTTQSLKGADRNVYGGGLGVNGYLSASNSGLFLHADVEGGNRLVYDAGLGSDISLFNRAVYLRPEILYHREEHIAGEPLVHLGLRIPFGHVFEAIAAPEAPPAEVVPAEPVAPPEEAPTPPAPPPPPAATCQVPLAGQPITLEGCAVGDTLVLRGVNFDFNKASLTVNAKSLLDQVADALRARSDVKVEIDGYTDGKGSDGYNRKLSERRAASVVRYLANHGIERARMRSKGFGKDNPIADNSTDEGRERNRRVELKVIEAGGAAAPASGDASAPSTTEGSAPPPHARHHRRARHRAAAATDDSSGADTDSTGSTMPAPSDSTTPSSQDSGASSPAAAPDHSADESGAPSPPSPPAPTPPQASSPSSPDSGDVQTEPAPAPPQ